MEARLRAVREKLWVLLATSVMLAGLLRPAMENRSLVRAFDELTAFRSSFARQDAEGRLVRAATSQGAQPVRAVAAAIKQERRLHVEVAPSAPVIPALAPTSQLETLAQVAALAQPGASLRIGILDVEALGASLTWRLARSQTSGTVTLRSIEILPAQVTLEDVALEREVERLRAASLTARSQMETATRQFEYIKVHPPSPARLKRRAKVRGKIPVTLGEANFAMGEMSKARDEAQQRYEAASLQAQRARKITSFSGEPPVALVRVSLDLGSEPSVFDIPAPLMWRPVPVPHLRVTNFMALRAASLWDRLKDSTPEAALSAVDEEFNWHLRSDGPTVLQLFPFLLPVLLGLLFLAVHRAQVSYSPFGANVPANLPTVGFGNAFFEFLTILALPLFAIGSAAVSLAVCDRVPVGPALSGVLCVSLGVVTFSKLRDLRDQTVSIVRHSVPPPAA